MNVNTLVIETSEGIVPYRWETINVALIVYIYGHTEKFRQIN